MSALDSNRPLTIALGPSFPQQFAHLLGDVSDRVRLVQLVEGSLPAEADQIEVLGTWGMSRQHVARIAPALPRLRWVQSPVAGIGDQRLHEVLPSGVVVTCAAGVYADMVAEHALMLILALYRRLPELLEFQRKEHWDPLETRTLAGQTLGVVGAGGIGQSLARMVRPLGMHALGVRRGGGSAPDFDRMFPLDGTRSLLAASDVVVLAMPLTPETTGMVDGDFLRSMRRSAVLVNVARGKVVVTSDLVAALHEGIIAGAGLDVTDPEPLPPGHPLWHTPRVIITPHHANPHLLSLEHAVRRFAENLAHYLAGEPLVAVVDAARGY